MPRPIYIYNAGLTQRTDFYPMNIPQSPWRLTLTYTLAAGLWVFFSDRLLATLGLPLAQLIGEASPERVAAGVAYLASEACEVSGCILSAGAGYFSTVQIVEGLGVHAPADAITPEFVAANWGRIADMSAARPFDSAVDALMGAFGPAKT